MSQLIISVSGLRGIVGQTLTPEIAARYAAALAAELPAGAIVITRDGRASGPALAEAVGSALHAAGRDTWEAGVAATPTTGVLVPQLGAVGAVQISASHNPAEYNGLKLFGGDGRVLPDAAGKRVGERFAAGAPPVSTERPGIARPVGDTTGAHLERVCACVDVERIRQRRFRVLLDSNHGAGSIGGQALLERLGCDVTVLGGTPDGQFAHTPEPTAENLAGILPRVREGRFDVGFCQDPDADRLALVDERGRYIGEEYTLALAVEHVLATRPGPIVTNCSTSRMAQDLAERRGAPFHRSAVGEANVVDKMLEVGAVLGGEGNGGVIEPRVVLVRDSLIAMAYTLDLMAARGRPLSELADALPRYEIVKTKYPLAAERLPAAYQALVARFPEAQASQLDGLRLDWPDKWLLVRGSNTEPIVRAIAEARTEAEAQALCDAAAEAIG